MKDLLSSLWAKSWIFYVYPISKSRQRTDGFLIQQSRLFRQKYVSGLLWVQLLVSRARRSFRSFDFWRASVNRNNREKSNSPQTKCSILLLLRRVKATTDKNFNFIKPSQGHKWHKAQNRLILSLLTIEVELKAGKANKRRFRRGFVLSTSWNCTRLKTESHCHCWR